MDSIKNVSSVIFKEFFYRTFILKGMSSSTNVVTLKKFDTPL